MAIPLLFFISVLPVFIIAIILYALDKEKEAVGTMFKYYALGLLAAVMAVILEMFVQLPTENNLLFIFIDCFFCIALVEEMAKMASLKIGLSGEKSYNNFYDSIIFSTAVSLGFAGIENVLYVLSSSMQSLSLGLGTGLLRAFLAVPGHVIFAIFMGFFLDKAVEARVNGKSAGFYNFLAIAVPTVLHGVYDFFCFTLGTFDSSAYLMMFILYIVFMYVSGVVLVVIGAKKSHLPFVQNNNLYNQYSNNVYQNNGATYNNGFTYDNNVNVYSSVNVDAYNNVRSCVNCGSQITGNFCPYCGTDNSQVVSEVNPFTSASGKICSYCGNVSQGNFCTRCGNQL